MICKSHTQRPSVPASQRPGGMAHTTRPLLQREGTERGAVEGQDWYSPVEYAILYESLVRRTPQAPLAA
ncbi:hypothetical protein C0Q88_13610 [Ralstonia pickettii]|uniref:Uncharacterized protein n=1 Tax=Ralstonia pickettii TaxID=329 RepID=A0A2N4TTB4_RALPI|nr:hypothetical protein C0Q88_13610 [Ralstonia pickettii]